MINIGRVLVSADEAVWKDVKDHDHSPVGAWRLVSVWSRLDARSWE